MRKLLLVAALVCVAVAARTDAAVGAGNAITTVAFYAGNSAVVIDAADNPVIAYRDAFTTRLNIMHCNDPLCTGGDESVTSPDPQPGAWPSILLDAAGNPVIAYYTTTFDRLKILHCNDPNCSGTETISTPDPDTFRLLYEMSLALDAAGNPVVAYSPPYELRVLHCNDPFCTGGDESVTVHENFVANPSLAIDSSGNPVVAFYKASGGNFSTGSLRVMHCNDPDCAGDNEIMTTPNGQPGIKPSMRLDAMGRPVIAYYTGSTTADLKVMHCNDVNCGGGNETINTVDATGDVGDDAELLLDNGNPLITYYDATNSALKLARCDDPDCTFTGDTVVVLDTAGDAGENSSPTIDGAGALAVTYDVDLDLNLLRCQDFKCAEPVGGLAELPAPIAPPSGGAPWSRLLALAGAGLVLAAGAALSGWADRTRRI